MTKITDLKKNENNLVLFNISKNWQLKISPVLGRQNMSLEDIKFLIAQKLYFFKNFLKIWIYLEGLRIELRS